MNEPIRRTDTVKIKLAPELMERVESQARAYGMAPSTLCAMAVAEWVIRQENNVKMSRMAVMDAMRGSVGADQVAAAVEAALPGVIKALSQQNLPIDGEAPPAGGAQS